MLPKKRMRKILRMFLILSKHLSKDKRKNKKVKYEKPQGFKGCQEVL